MIADGTPYTPRSDALQDFLDNTPSLLEELRNLRGEEHALSDRCKRIESILIAANVEIPDDLFSSRRRAGKLGAAAKHGTKPRGSA